MIYNQTLFRVTDNSGARSVKCFKFPKYSHKKVGAIIYVIVKKIKNFDKLKEGSVIKSIVIRTKFSFNKLNGNFVNFSSNDVVLINNKEELLCTRIFGPLILELRKKQKIRILSIGSKIL